MSTQHDDKELDQVSPAIDSAVYSLLTQIRGGQILTDLSQSVRDAVEATQLHGKPSGITLQLVFKPAANGSNAIVVADKIKVKLPEPKPVVSFFFSDTDGNLHRNDPNQRELPLRTITGGKPVEVETLRRASVQ